MNRSESDKLEKMFRTGINEQKVNRMNDGKAAKAAQKAVFDRKPAKKGKGK